MKRIMKHVLSLALAIIMVISVFSCVCASVQAKTQTLSLKGTQYKFDKKCKYVISKAEEKKSIKGKTQFGEISLEGNVKSITKQNGVQAFEVSSGTVSIKYKIDTKLDIIKDKVKKVSNATLESNVLKGAIIVQSSLDGEKWILDKAYTDVLGDNDDSFKAAVFESNDIQQTNGGYFRVVIAYKADIKENGDTKTYRYAEVYKFYLINREQGNVTSINTSPKYVYDGNRFLRPQHNGAGYNADIIPELDDPHTGWILGDFIINGFTSYDEPQDASNVWGKTQVFLKNAGDQITMWFSLYQDINKLNGNEELSINDEKNTYDSYFDIPPTDFRRGALFIRKIDSNGEKVTIPYINYLEACCRTGADTKVQLFEEGDYEVQLDYQIKDTSGLLSNITSYCIYFKFRIRNSNIMIFPFDLKTNGELQNCSITENGFRLDFAESKYIKVYVQYMAIGFNGTSYYADTRANKAAKDGAEYKEEGAYIISVRREYGGEISTDKVLYIGNSPIIRCLAKNKLTPDQLYIVNEKLSEGWILDENGDYVNEEQSETEEQDDGKRENENDEELKANNTGSDVVDEFIDKPESTKTDDHTNIFIVVIVACVISALIALFRVLRFKMKNINKDTEDVKSDEEAK